MLILAFDTTSEYGGAAVYRDDQCLVSRANDGPANLYSVTLFQMVDELLEAVRARNAVPSLTLRNIELFGVANGPGSFTGIRVGLAAAQAWAKAFARPVRGVSVLEAMVEGAHPETEWAVPILDARRGEFFVSLYRHPWPEKHGGQAAFEADGEGWVVKPNALGSFLAERLPAGTSVTLLTREHDRLAEGLRESLLKSLAPTSVGWQTVPGFLVGAVARVALRSQRQGKLQDPAELDAYYIRRSDAELKWRG